jgi:hypothetical protein
MKGGSREEGGRGPIAVVADLLSVFEGGIRIKLQKGGLKTLSPHLKRGSGLLAMATAGPRLR